MEAHLRDSVLLRFANVVNTLQDEVFRLAASEELIKETFRPSRRDVLDYMERVGIVADADRFLDATKLRNRLSHGYRDDPAAQAALTNDVWQAIGTVLDAVERAEAWARARGLIPG